MKKVPIEEIVETGISYVPMTKTMLWVTFSVNGWTPIIEEYDSKEGGIIIACFDKHIAMQVAHCLNTHQMLLDALKHCHGWLQGIAERNPEVEWIQRDFSHIEQAIESASFVEVQE